MPHKASDHLLLLAQNRIADGGLKYTAPFREAMSDHRIFDKEIEKAEDLDIERTIKLILSRKHSPT